MRRTPVISSRRGRLVAALVASSCAAALAAGPFGSTAVAADKPQAAHNVTFTSWDFGDGDPGGDYDGAQRSDGGMLTMEGATTPTTMRSYDDPHDAAATLVTYDEGTWVSPEIDPATFDFTELIASWNAHTPGGSWIEVSVTGTTKGAVAGGTKDYVLGRWSENDDKGFHSTSVPGQGDVQATVAIDTLVARPGVTFDDAQIRVSLLRPQNSPVSPTVDFIGAMASQVVAAKKHTVSATTMKPTEDDLVLDVPTYSQETHIGHYPQWDGGGEAWCSPTSTTMVVRYWDEDAPPAADYGWVFGNEATHSDRYVDYAARYTYDYNYDGAGNWPFNTAYAARFGNEAFVTRLRSLAEAEQFIKEDIPLVVSMSFKKGELSGAGYGSNGHLLTIVGFEADGDVVVNDPASHLIQSNDEVRVTYDRAEFEAAWIGTTGGITYVIHPEAKPLPPALAGAPANW